MSTYVLYDPFVEFDRLFNEALSSRCHTSQRRRDHADNTVSAIKPRYDSIFLSERDKVVDNFRRMDLHEDPEKNTVTATLELPGVSKENVNIDVHNGCLIIAGENKISSEHDENGYAVRERRYGKFSRTVQLPQGVKVRNFYCMGPSALLMVTKQDSEVIASMDNGVLTVTFPKTTPEMAPKKVQIA